MPFYRYLGGKLLLIADGTAAPTTPTPTPTDPTVPPSGTGLAPRSTLLTSPTLLTKN